MSTERARYSVTRRWRFHYPSLYVTRVRLHDDQGGHVDLWDAEQAANVARVLNQDEKPTKKGLTKYRTLPWVGHKALIEQRLGAAVEETVGIASDRALADRVADALNDLDPYKVIPAKRFGIYWF